MTSLLSRPPSSQAGRLMLTEAGREALRRKAELLRDTVLPELLLALAERNRDGRVDAEYHRVRAEIAVLDELTSRAASTKDRPGEDPIGMGDHVVLALPHGERLEVLLTCEQEAALDELRISVFSPLARALSGRRAGDTITVESPKGAYQAQVLASWRG